MPPLEALGNRWGAAALVEYLMDPKPLRAGNLSRMPDFHLDGGEATALAIHLLRDDDSRGTRRTLDALRARHPTATAARGAAIARALNCAGCHPATGVEAWPVGPPLTSLGDRLRPVWVRGYLATPRAVRPFGYYPGSGSRMPDFDLTAAEVDSLTRWLTATPRRTPGAGPEDAESRTKRPAAPQLSAFRAAKAESMVRDQLSCLGCHQLNGEGGKVAPPLDAANARLRTAYLRQVVRNPAAAGPGAIMPAPMHDSATGALITAWLLQQTPAPAPPPDRAAERDPRRGYLSLLENPPRRPDLAAAAGDGQALYGRYCAVCHGPAGGGDGFNAAFLPVRPTVHADSGHMATRADATLFDGIHSGGHVLGRSHRMPPFGGTLSRGETLDLIAHLRELCDCEQPVWARIEADPPAAADGSPANDSTANGSGRESS